MKPERQRIKIAEACGYLDIHRCTRNMKARPDGVCLCGTKDGPSINYPRDYEFIPDYLNDLNAMHEAERALAEDQLREYSDWLLVIVVAAGKPSGWFNATAEQRAEAFLRTLNLWEDE